MRTSQAKRFGWTALWVILFCAITAMSTWAQGPTRVNVTTTQPQKMTLVEGKSIIFSIQNPIPIKVVSADSAIAEVKDLTDYQSYIIGKKAGVTNLTLYSKQNKRLIQVFDVEVIPDINRLKEKLHELYPKEDVKVTADNDAITLSGSASSTAAMSQVLALAQAYAPRDEKDKDRKPKINNFLEVGGVHQVMLEVRVSEMSRSIMKKLGINWNYISGNGQTFGLSLLDNLSQLVKSGDATVPGGLSMTYANPINMIFRFGAGGATWTTFIDALKENGLVKVMAEPTLITLSGKPANFLAGGEFPIPVPNGTNGVTIDYKSYGVGLNFAPTVLSNGKISMEVAPEVSELDFNNAVTLQGFVVPAITLRRVATSIELADGQSFAIAGLLKDDVRDVARKFPLLGDIPVLGALFRSSSFQKSETELVIVVTPHLVKPLDTKKQPLPTDQYIEPNDLEFYLLGDLEGRGQPPESRNPAAGPTTGAFNKNGGLEGEFGHIVQ